MDSGFPWAPSATWTVTAIVTAALVSLASSSLRPQQDKIQPSPLKTVLPRLSRDEVDGLVYQPDQFPGARDVETPVCEGE